jgi:hypothetical protein
MSFFLSPYLLNITKAHAAIGSGEVQQRRIIGGKNKADMARADDYFADEIAAGAPTRYEALRAVIDGGPFLEGHGFQYAYAYQMICGFHGRHISNEGFGPFRSPSWLDRVDDEGLAAIGITSVRTADFMRAALPSPLPDPEEYPCYAEWSPEECAAALAEWQAADPDIKKFSALDPDIKSPVNTVIGWLKDAERKPGSGVASFFF